MRLLGSAEGISPTYIVTTTRCCRNGSTASAWQARRMASAPLAPQHAHTLTSFGHERLDPWYWLRERDNPEVLAYLEAENTHTEEELAPLQQLRESLFEEMKSRILETDMSVPSRRGPWWYYARSEE